MPAGTGTSGRTPPQFLKLNFEQDDLLSEKKAFDDSKAGVKGLVDAGIVDIPRIFIRPPDELAQELSRCRLQVTNKLFFCRHLNCDSLSVGVLVRAVVLFLLLQKNVNVQEKVIDYTNHVKKLGDTLLDLLSEALGLNTDCLKSMECAKGKTLVCHYYSACPQPELTLGTDKHTEPDFLTILLQDQSGGAL
ncbi:1-aminocyclopropane-1-carboxylate oxidase -like protein 6 [Capsicum baccatum]|uniref:1-aminocyclopropane-1-carboxylate oxidase-like protein 6 n=1 Tax=Capsicum baccatum TaxID=33114 RepID=A0A2G2W297_CAPBA|nr:1-aminocyclopropane-1-carboxylate oxidase -like protein 6 [Capsicum baccatum]